MCHYTELLVMCRWQGLVLFGITQLSKQAEGQAGTLDRFQFEWQ